MQTQADVMELVRAQFEPSHHWIAKPEHLKGEADALAVCFLDKMTTTAIEVRRDRKTWLADLKVHNQPMTRAYVDYWYIVAPEGVVLPKEIYHGAGLFLVKKGVLVREQLPAESTATSPTMDRNLAASIIRAVVQNLPKTPSTKKAYEKGYQEAARDLTGSKHWKELGPERLAAFFRALDSGLHRKVALELKLTLDQAKEHAQRIEERVKGLEGVSDWRTGTEWSPAAVEYGEKVRAHLQEQGTFTNLSPEEIEKLIDRHRATFTNGDPAFTF